MKRSPTPVTQGNTQQTRSIDLQFRSPLLAPMPQTDAPGRTRRMLTRLLVVAFLALAIWCPAATIANQLFPESGPLGRGLYWLHDDVFLPIKGYTYTYRFPMSLVQWGLITTILALKLFHFITGRSVVRGLHVWLLWRLVRWHRSHKYLVLVTQWLNRWGVEPGTLKATAEYEHTLAVGRLAQLPQPKVNETLTRKKERTAKKICHAAAHQTRLLTRLFTLPRSTTADHLKAAALWHQAFLQIRIHGDGHTDLADDVLLITKPVLDSQINSRDQEGSPGPDSPGEGPATQIDGHGEKAATQQAVFTPKNAMIDLLYLACLENENEKIIEELNRQEQPGAALPSAQGKRDQVIRKRLAASVEARRTALDKARAHTEMQVFQNRFLLSESDEDIAAMIPADNTNLSTIGQLSLSIALDLARQTEEPDIARGYIDSVEALTLALKTVAIDTNTPSPDYIKWLSTLAGNLPHPEHYGLCAKLTQSKHDTRTEEWQQAPLSSDGADGFALAQTQIDSLHHAAGPGAQNRLWPIRKPKRRRNPHKWRERLLKWMEEHRKAIVRVDVLLGCIVVYLVAVYGKDIVASINWLIKWLTVLLENLNQ